MSINFPVLARKAYVVVFFMQHNYEGKLQAHTSENFIRSYKNQELHLKVFLGW
jgi:hypothetical protein